LGNINRGFNTLSHIISFYNYSALISQIETKSTEEGIPNKHYLLAMQEELN